jgi:TolB-like protein/DNA-binding winged helix-turn-helix (wHTH) protein
MSEPQREMSMVSESLHFADCRLDLRRGRAFRGDEEIQLRPKTFEVLCHLARNAGRVVTKAELMDAVWRDTAVTDNSLVQCLLEIRKALKDDDQSIVRTVARRGYLLEAAQRLEPVAWPREAAPPRRAPRWSNAWLAVALVFVAAGAAAAFLLWPSSPAAGSLAVLPFHSLESKPAPGGFELGLTDTLITRLSLARGLAVRPWASVQLYIGSTTEPIRIGQELRVEAVLDGTVQKNGERVRVTARLYRVSDGKLLWSEAFDEDVEDAFALQDSISERVARALYVELGEKPRPRVSREAFEAYARGRYFFELFTREGNWMAVQYLEQAIARAPDFAEAHATLALNYGPMIVRGFIDPQDGLQKLDRAARRAMELDESLPESNLAMALVYLGLGDWERSDRQFKRSVELNPNYLHGWGFYAFLLHALGRHDEALTASRNALEIDPVSDYASKNLADSLIWAGRYEEALEQAKRAVELRPDFTPAQAVLARAYVKLNRLDEAHQYLTLAGDRVSAARVRVQQGDPRPIHALLEELRGQPGADLALAPLYVSVGDHENALAALESAASRSGYRPMVLTLLYLAVDDRFEPLRREPRFQALVDRLKLPRHW